MTNVPIPKPGATVHVSTPAKIRSEPTMLWIGDPGSRDAPDERRATYMGPAKPFCPCDTGEPQDCKPEEWGGAHAPRPPCERCGNPLYRHQGNYCYRPTPYAPYFDSNWIWYAITHDVPWTAKAVQIVQAALELRMGRRVVVDRILSCPEHDDDGNRVTGWYWTIMVRAS